MSKLQDEIREHMSPQAVALTVAHLQTVYGEGPACAEVQWLRDQLTEMVGGSEELGRLMDEVGV